MNIKGADEIIKKLERLANAGKLTASRTALLQSSNVVKKAAVTKAKAIDDPATANDISKNITVQFDRKSFNRNGDVKYRIGVAGGAKEGGNGGRGGDTFYWRFHEFGTRHMPARPFLRPAIDENKEAAVDKFAEVMKKQIDKEVK
ncbi:MAG: HK97-gp10 family putative phage morphogenesis protein [Wohlfahrtiimonas sp.]